MTDLLLNNLEELPIKNLRSKAVPEGVKTKRKKAINFLKQEMSNIREGMTKIMQVKSEDSLKKSSVIRIKANNQADEAEKIASSKDSVQNIQSQANQEIILLRERVSFLETENQKLIHELRNMQIKNYHDIENLIKHKISLQAQNDSLYTQINRLASQVQNLICQVKQFKSKKSRKSKKSEWRPESLNEFFINPEYESEGMYSAFKIDLEKVIRQKNKLIEKVNILESELELKDAILMQDRKTIEDLNSQILTFNLVGLNQKYKKINIF